VTTGGNEIDTSAAATVNYQATLQDSRQSGLLVHRQQVSRHANGAATIRSRRSPSVRHDMDLTYQVLHWLSIRPTPAIRPGTSNVKALLFDGNVIGVELLAKQFRPNR